MDSEFESLLRCVDGAQPGAADRLFAICYAELHRLAEHNLWRSGSTVTLGPTTLLHEAYLNIVGRANVAFADRPRFLNYASRAMRGLIIDYARRRRTRKCGRQFEITLATDEELPAHPDHGAEDLVRLGEALDELSTLEPALAQLVDLHFFCGFSFTEIATMRHVSDRTVQRDWRKARLLLHQALLDEESPGG